ncbi:MAG TPA: FHA domain-containing protein [Steroidobacteraceae bacterium]|nr:FHA domain-containing protein [Steroidobacteraceae bacterium]
MARLVLSLDGQVLAEYNMSKERYTVGRLPDNDIRIDNPAVSGHHALLINILNDSYLEDLNSTNGTYVNGRLVKKHALQNGDNITVGHHMLRFVDGEGGEAADDEFEKTMVISSADAANYPAPAGASAPRATAEPAAAPAQPVPVAAAAPPAAPPPSGGVLPRAKLQVLSGQFAGRELDLVKTLTTMGRPGVQVAAITRRADGFYIVHMESGKEGDYPLVNGTPIGPQARRLHDNDVVQLAGVKMGFFES